MLTCKWVTGDDGALVMQWTEQRRAARTPAPHPYRPAARRCPEDLRHRKTHYGSGRHPHGRQWRDKPPGPALWPRPTGSPCRRPRPINVLALP